MVMDHTKTSRFTVVNEDNGYIYLSKSLLNKIAQEEQKLQAPKESVKVDSGSGVAHKPEKALMPPSSEVAGLSQMHVNPNAYFESVNSTPQTSDSSKVMNYAAFDPSVLMYGIRGEYERKFQQYQYLWRQKWDELDRLNKDMHKKNSDLLAKEVHRVDEAYFRQHSAYEPPCVEAESSVLQCYDRNPKKPLLCSEEVKKFAQCIEQSRLSMLKHK